MSLTQLRALLRAGAKHKNIKIMLPLVTGIEEFHSARALLQQCRLIWSGRDWSTTARLHSA